MKNFAIYSRESTPAMLDELRFLRESTPIKQMSSIFSPLANDSADINSSDNSNSFHLYLNIFSAK